jgi:hypothetical protein
MADAASPVIFKADRAVPPPRRARGRRLLAVAAIVALAASAFVLRVSRTMPDFEVYWRAGERAAAAEPLYRAADGHYQFKYLPAFAVLAIPLGVPPLQVAKALWFGLSVAALAVLLRLSVRVLPMQRKPEWALVLLVVIALGKFYGHELVLGLVLGQVNLLFAAVATGSIVALKTRRAAVAGALVALAVVLKPYGVLLLPWLLARGTSRSSVVAAAGIGGALLLPAALYGIEGDIALHRDWLATTFTSTAPNILNVDNVSWLAMYTRWYGIGPTATTLAALTAAAALSVIVWTWRAGRTMVHPGGLEAALLLVFIPLMSPQGWDYVLLLSTPAVVYLANYEDRLPGALRPLTLAALAVVGLTTFDLMGRAAYAAFMRMSSITICYFVVIAALVVLRSQKTA